MSSETTALEKAPTEKNLRALVRMPQYQARFQEVLGDRAAQFVTSLISVGNSLGPDCDPMSIIATSMNAAALDLPIDKNLGFAWLVPYKQRGVKYAQFQLGYKGCIQLALRTGQYERMNARVINQEAFDGWDEMGEPKILWDKVDDTKPAVGYAFTFKLVSGFKKTACWTKARVEEHAKRYSQSFRGTFDSPWKSNFDAMALKTVVKNELSHWGIMSIQMSDAFRRDQSVQKDIDVDIEYIDGLDNHEAAPKFLSDTAGKDKLFPTKLGELTTKIAEGKLTNDDVLSYMKSMGLADETLASLDEVNEVKASSIETVLNAWPDVEKKIKKFKSAKM